MLHFKAACRCFEQVLVVVEMKLFSLLLVRTHLCELFANWVLLYSVLMNNVSSSALFDFVEFVLQQFGCFRKGKI